MLKARWSSLTKGAPATLRSALQPVEERPAGAACPQSYKQAKCQQQSCRNQGFVGGSRVAAGAF